MRSMFSDWARFRLAANFCSIDFPLGVVIELILQHIIYKEHEAICRVSCHELMLIHHR